ncbi:Putative integral membrane protein conserved region (DUF2404) [Musa troglodytarum]|uniref:Integral membrane protein conserved region (DUF2404) n=1 Tax=Musa troglodytarum TaxID=320322 RepID=A0A9E7GWA3_9LILI|nr:Putative integral membrane protein conserved region (DUF2404) [Musa troglodytarum]
MLVSFLFGFVAGFVALVAAESLALLWLIGRLRRKRLAVGVPSRSQLIARGLDAERSLTVPFEKKGSVWVLEPKKVRKINTDELPKKGTKGQKKNDILEVIPIKRYAKIKDQSLILSNSDGSKTTIQLLGCTVVAVSASNLASRNVDGQTRLVSARTCNLSTVYGCAQQRAKRYPIKLESNDSKIYKGSKACYLYFDTSWEKESWCKALRLASCPDRGKWNWFSQLGEDFQDYLSSLSVEYPSFLKPSTLYTKATNRTSRIDGSFRVQFFLKKISKKASKNALESRQSLISSSNCGERNIDDRLPSTTGAPSSDGFVISSYEDKFSTADEKKFVNDKGTLCWNLLLSRLFFDAKNSIEINNLIKACIQDSDISFLCEQRMLSNTRRPSYMCEISCTGLDLGSVLPYIHRMRVFPVDLNQVLSMEIDIEYSGGIILDIETRLKVRELELQKDLIKTSLESNSTDELNSDFLEGIEHYGNQLKSSSNSATGMGNRNEVDKADGLRNSKSATWTSGYVSRWKAVLHSLANQVSQVPLSLSIRVASLRGTLRLYIKPPPSDQLWFGFTTMPELDWNLESSVGDRKITSSHIALLISNRFKAAIRDSLVLPNCETMCMPWMLAEKDDWVPRKVAPFMWINNEKTEMTWPEFLVAQNREDKLKLDGSNKTKYSLDDKVDGAKNVIHEALPESSTSGGRVIGSATPDHSHGGMNTYLKTPLLLTCETKNSYSQSSIEAVATVDDQPTLLPSEEDEKPKKSSRHTF